MARRLRSGETLIFSRWEGHLETSLPLLRMSPSTCSERRGPGAAGLGADPDPGRAARLFPAVGSSQPGSPSRVHDPCSAPPPLSYADLGECRLLTVALGLPPLSLPPPVTTSGSCLGEPAAGATWTGPVPKHPPTRTCLPRCPGSATQLGGRNYKSVRTQNQLYKITSKCFIQKWFSAAPCVLRTQQQGEIPGACGLAGLPSPVLSRGEGTLTGCAVCPPPCPSEPRAALQALTGWCRQCLHHTGGRNSG